MQEITITGGIFCFGKVLHDTHAFCFSLISRSSIGLYASLYSKSKAAKKKHGSLLIDRFKFSSGLANDEQICNASNQHKYQLWKKDIIATLFNINPLISNVSLFIIKIASRFLRLIKKEQTKPIHEFVINTLLISTISNVLLLTLTIRVGTSCLPKTYELLIWLAKKAKILFE